MWALKGYDVVPSDDVCWTRLVHVEVQEGSDWKKIQKEDMTVGQAGIALFKTSAGKSQCEVTRTA